MPDAQAAALADLRRIPGVGKSIAMDFYLQGFRRVDQLASCDPEQLYQRQCELQGCHVDRCWLYVARLAVYFAQTPPAQQPPEMVELERLNTQMRQIYAVLL